MKKQNEKKSYCTPVIKVVSFQIESGFAGSGENFTTPLISGYAMQDYEDGGSNIFGQTF